jgi:hypothetical protein
MRKRRRRLPRNKARKVRRRFGMTNVKPHGREPRGPNRGKPRVSVRKYRRGVAR